MIKTLYAHAQLHLRNPLSLLWLYVLLINDLFYISSEVTD